MKSFRDYKAEERRNYITLSSGEYYPDILVDACKLYSPVLTIFSELLHSSESSIALFKNICKTPTQWMRIQLCRVFRKYCSPETPVEMLKKSSQVIKICNEFGEGFRPINIIQERFDSRPFPDEALCAVLWEYKDRGQKGYDLTEKFFDIIESTFSDVIIWGPRRSGADIQPISFWKDYPNARRPLDFVISSPDKSVIYAVGLARYDGDRGGAQEDDRTGGYKNCADEILDYVKNHNLHTKVIFVNDGPGLLLGSMWEDYSIIEERYKDECIVTTLRMIPERISKEWLLGR